MAAGHDGRARLEAGLGGGGLGDLPHHLGGRDHGRQQALLVAEVVDGRVREIERQSTVTRLGRGVDTSGQLAAEAIEELRFCAGGQFDPVVVEAVCAELTAPAGAEVESRAAPRRGAGPAPALGEVTALGS